MRLSNEYRILSCRRRANWGTDGDFITPEGKVIHAGENHTIFMMDHPEMFGDSREPDDMIYQGWIRTRTLFGTFSVDARGGMNDRQLHVLRRMVQDHRKYSDPRIEVLMDDESLYTLACDDFDEVEYPNQIKRRGLRSASRSVEVPPAPGMTPIPPDHVRLYHYTDPEGGTEEEAAERILRGGIDIGRAKGSTYGEPDVVWASTKPPESHKVFVEFDIHKDDPRWGIGRPRTPQDVEWLNKGNIDVTFNDSIRPEDITAVHLPWHGTYRYLQENDMLSRVVDGEFDHLLSKPDSNEAKAIKYIKSQHGSPGRNHQSHDQPLNET